MKTNRSVVLSARASLLAVGMLMGWALTSAGQTQPPSGQQPPDSVVAVVAAAQGLPSVSAEDQPPFGTYWEAYNSLPCVTAPLPCPPADPTTPVYALGGGHFLADLTAGPLVGLLPSPYRNRALSAADYAAILQAQVDELQNFIVQDQAWQLSAQASRNGTMAALGQDAPPPLPGGGDGGTNIWQGGGTTFNGKSFGTNDLWLQILSVSLSNSAANLVIHPPWNVTNGVYELLYCTSLAPPISWQWVLRTDPGQTNLKVFNAADPQGFYRLKVPTDSTGTNFWLAFPYMAILDSHWPQNLYLYICSSVAATGTVSIPGFGFSQAFSVGSGAVCTIAITNDDAMIDPDAYDEVGTNGINVSASQPVSVVAFNFALKSSAAFNCLPTTLLGTNYWVMARPTDVDFSGFGCYSEFAIVATADNTTVWITPSPAANLPGHTNLYQVPNLMQGQTYEIGTYNNDDNNDYASDVTGTWITSDKPIVLLAGASGAYVPDANTCSANPLVQEQLPVDTWGQQALALSFAGRTNGDSYRVLAAYSNTVVTISGLVVTSVDESSAPWTVTTSNEVVVAVITNAGQFYDIILEGPLEFQASKPIQVAQFANGTYFDGTGYFFDTYVGDPCEILLLPTGCYLETNSFFTPPCDFSILGDFTANFVTIIAPQSALTNTLLDGATVAATNFVPIGTSGYYGAQLPVPSSGAHTVTSSQPIGVQVYGFGLEDAYGYFGGLVK